MASETMEIPFLDSITPLLTDIGVALIILLLGFIIGKIAKILLGKILVELQVDKGLKAIRKKDLLVRKTLPLIVSIAIYAAAVILALTHLEILGAVLKGLAALVMLIVAGSIILWLSGLLPNVFAGFRLRSKKNFRKGLIIESKALRGRIEKIGLLKTKIVRGEDVLFVPNKTLSEKKSVIGRYTLKK